ncbi:hypothetical protein IFN73_12110 [Francisella tularensis subsp. holarctica]|nr:hypothetical protein [Francisella tularensis subsp. holarctica]
MILKYHKNHTYSDNKSINQVEANNTDQKTIHGAEYWKTISEKTEFLKALVENESIFESYSVIMICKTY